MIVAGSEENDGSHAEEDENYFVSMTDMMVGILFIFIIMLMVFALNFRQQTDEKQDQIKDANELAEQIAALRSQIEGEITELDRADQARNELLEAIKARLDVVGLEVTIDKDTGVLRLAEDAIRFAPQNSQLDAKAQRNVDAVAQVLLDILPGYTCQKGNACERSTGYVVETVFIEGHTDKTGWDSLNWELSTERAVNTYRRIVDNFPRLREFVNSRDREILSVSGYASTRPAIERDDTEGYRINRRIDLRFVMEADRRERLKEVLQLLDQMERKVDELKAPGVEGATGGTALPEGRP
jgi:flagellar motor protein MotB